jgi:hypothetical protein
VAHSRDLCCWQVVVVVEKLGSIWSDDVILMCRPSSHLHQQQLLQSSSTPSIASVCSKAGASHPNREARSPLYRLGLHDHWLRRVVAAEQHHTASNETSQSDGVNSTTPHRCPRNFPRQQRVGLRTTNFLLPS